MIGLEEAFLKSETPKRQVFLTQSPVLAKQVEEAFFNLWESNMARKGENNLKLRRKLVRQKQSSLLDLDSESTDMSHLPDKFSELQDCHFPLFLTFQQLCILLERDIGQRYKNFLTFEQFRTSLWDHFSEKKRKNLDASLVFSEIIGVIKGHEMAAATNTGYLDRDTYMSIRRRRFTDESYRWRIYDLFEDYQRDKRGLNLNDSPERTHAILKEINIRFPGVKFDYLYIDEAQDNLIIDSCLLRRLCKSPHGLFWAGDTAQTIAPGSSFRFNDLKALFYRMEEQDPAVKYGHRSAVHPEFFQLVTNYRSHSGILRPASHIVKLLMHFFPTAIDSLAPEVGSTEGPRPLFAVIPNGGDNNALSSLFTNSGKASVEFGAEQVILVRDVQSQISLQNEIGRKKALVLTIYESKGLEFNDVLLYNFFADSMANAEDWQSILKDMESPTTHNPEDHVPHFSQERHAILERELKNLYVAITRARKHLWIWDLSDKSQPLKASWLRKGFFANAEGKNFNTLLKNDSSTSEDWKRKAQQFFEKRQYAHAATCFSRAGPQYAWEESVAIAYQLRMEAQSFLSSNSQYLPTWKESAEKFCACAEKAPSESEREGLLRRAGQCYEEVKLHKEAAGLYVQARCFENAIVQYRLVRDVDNALGIVNKFEKLIPEERRSSTIAWAKLEYSRQEEFKKARALFADDDEYLQFLKENDLLTQIIACLEAFGRYLDAAKMCLDRDNETKAMDLLRKASSSEAKTILKNIVERGLSRRFSLSMAPASNDAVVKRYMDTVKGEKLQSDEIELCEAIWRENKVRLPQLAQKFRDDGNRLALAVIAYHRHLALSTEQVKRRSATHLEDLIKLHAKFLSLQSQIREVGVGNPCLKRLFNYQDPTNAGEYEVGRFSYLYPKVKDHPRAVIHPSRKMVVIDGNYLRFIVETAISTLFNERLSLLHDFAVALDKKNLITGRTDAIVQGVFEPLWRLFNSARMTGYSSYWYDKIAVCLEEITRPNKTLPFSFIPQAAKSALITGVSLKPERSVDILNLIRYVEGLVGHLAISSHICRRFRNSDATQVPDSVLHNLILPPKWFCSTLPNSCWPRMGDWEAGVNNIGKESSDMIELLHQVMSLLYEPPKSSTSTIRLAFNGLKISKVPKLTRWALLSRITYVLVYLGSAVQHPSISHKMAVAVRQIPAHIPRCYNWLAGIDDPRAMIETLRRISVSKPEAPVRLFYGIGPLPEAQTRSRLECVYYSDDHDLLAKMWRLSGSHHLR
ncbi:hypothetical protein FRC02_010418 [Tulasnella sp. 418]|nr:hypothetical protein FRC02_010418 [Tulasnella sp. 418]